MIGNKTCIKFCGLSRPEDIDAVNSLKTEYVGFVFWEKSKRNVSRKLAGDLKKALLPGIKAVGVFVDEDPKVIADLMEEEIIDIAQLHGSEDEDYIGRLRVLIEKKPIIKAIVIKGKEDIEKAEKCSADFLLLDSGKGTGQTFNWELIKNAGFKKPFFLAGGLDPSNVADAVNELHPYAVDVSSGIETYGVKDPEKMRAFDAAVRTIT